MFNNPIENYEWLQHCLQTMLSEEGDTFAPGIKEHLETFRKSLVPILETENDSALSSATGTISDETLRNYIKISRDIRDFLFRNIDTHVLTIEKLADQILCRRRAYERRTKDTTRQAGTTNAPSTKAVVAKQTAPKDSVVDVMQQMANLPASELAKVLALLQKK